nr:cytoplasmic tRNA 2-thiolation protein 2-like isoform X2 [Dermatophagoides farinae]
MCDRFNLDDDDQDKSVSVSNVVFHRFKKNLNYQMNCRKCQQNRGSVLLQKKDVFCNDCLIGHCTKTFRTTIGKSRLLKSEDKILVGFSGGLSSVALVDLIRRRLDEEQFQKLRFIPSLLFIDESILDNERQIFLTKELFEFICQAKMDCYFISLQSCIGDFSNHIVMKDDTMTIQNIKDFFVQNNHSECAQRFLQNINKFRDPTLKYDFLQRFRYLILMKMAYHLNMDKVFVASTLNELSVGLMNNISLGRGIIGPNEINFCDNRYGSILLLRPMCELVSKEVVFYLKFRKLDHIPCKPDFLTSTRFPLKSSLHRLNEHFLTSLSEEFPSTIHTVFKTGNKIKSTTSTVVSLIRCKFCLAQLENQSDDEYSSYDALKLTSILSIGSEQQSSSCIDGEKFSHYCYSCSRLCNEINDKTDQFEQFCILSSLLIAKDENQSL